MKKFSEEEIEKMLDEYEIETLIYRMYTGKGVEGMLKLSNFYYHHYNEYTRIFLAGIPCAIVHLIDIVEYIRENWKDWREDTKSKKQ